MVQIHTPVYLQAYDAIKYSIQWLEILVFLSVLENLQYCIGGRENWLTHSLEAAESTNIDSFGETRPPCLSQTQVSCSPDTSPVVSSSSVTSREVVLHVRPMTGTWWWWWWWSGEGSVVLKKESESLRNEGDDGLTCKGITWLEG